jgi:hypothetical protein
MVVRGDRGAWVLPSYQHLGCYFVVDLRRSERGWLIGECGMPVSAASLYAMLRHVLEGDPISWTIEPAPAWIYEHIPRVALRV